jgi:hypothetical protein
VSNKFERNQPELHTVLTPDASPSCRHAPPPRREALLRFCADPEGFDRAAFHVEFDRQVVGFFRAHLLPSP